MEVGNYRPMLMLFINNKITQQNKGMTMLAYFNIIVSLSRFCMLLTGSGIMLQTLIISCPSLIIYKHQLSVPVFITILSYLIIITHFIIHTTFDVETTIISVTLELHSSMLPENSINLFSRIKHASVIKVW